MILRLNIKVNIKPNLNLRNGNTYNYTELYLKNENDNIED